MEPPRSSTSSQGAGDNVGRDNIVSAWCVISATTLGCWAAEGSRFVKSWSEASEKGCASLYIFSMSTISVVQPITLVCTKPNRLCRYRQPHWRTVQSRRITSGQNGRICSKSCSCEHDLLDFKFGCEQPSSKSAVNSWLRAWTENNSPSNIRGRIILGLIQLSRSRSNVLIFHLR